MVKEIIINEINESTEELMSGKKATTRKVKYFYDTEAIIPDDKEVWVIDFNYGDGTDEDLEPLAYQTSLDPNYLKSSKEGIQEYNDNDKIFLVTKIVELEKGDNFKFEEEVIDPILNCIKDNQKYLTKPKNLPQLAKLGYMYNTLWYSGRLCWGYSGVLFEKYGTFEITDEDGETYDYHPCEDNPKYKIEMCEPDNDEIENLIYDAWGMHVHNMEEQKEGADFNEFENLILNGKPISKFEKKLRKPNKTFDEWVNVLTNPEYRYSSLYPDRKSVLNHLLCVIGNGYGISKDGFIISEASGADVDIDLYGNWENAKFPKNIKKIVDKILSMDEVKEVLNEAHEYRKKLIEERNKEERKRNEYFYEALKTANLYDESEGELELSEILKRLDKGANKNDQSKEEKYSKYYPICNYSIIYKICDEETRIREGIKNVHQSYIDACVEICKDILNHQEEESKDNGDNIMYAKKFLTFLGFKEYEKDLPKEIDKYKLYDDIKEILSSLNLSEIENYTSENYGSNGYNINFKNTAKSQYGDNNYYITISYEDNKNFPIGISNEIDFLESSIHYKEIKNIYDQLNNLDYDQSVLFYFRNQSYGYHKNKVIIDISISANSDVKYFNHKLNIENDFRKLGFSIGKYDLELKINELGFTLTTQKPEPLGIDHPDNKNKKEFFSKSKSFEIYDENDNEIVSINLDERKYNTITFKSGDKNIYNWISNEHEKMKSSDKKYGTYGNSINDNDLDTEESIGDFIDNMTKEGSESLYAQDFMLWLKDNQSNFKKYEEVN